MSKGKDPAFLFYPNDFILGTYTMTDEQVGIYIRLLAISHTKGGKLTESEFFKINHTKDTEVTCKFSIDEQGMYYNKRLLEEIEERKRRNEVNKENGNKGGNPNFAKGKINPYYQKDNQTVMSSVMLEDNPIDKRSDNQKINIALENENVIINEVKDVDLNVVKKSKSLNRELVESIVIYLNNKLNTKFRVDSNEELINARLNEGRTFDDFAQVIDKKYSEWVGTEMATYLRPKTLFNKTNFENYLNQISTKESDSQRIARTYGGFLND
jgi:uncharacterized phage protein (TIGR02220 family)